MALASTATSALQDAGFVGTWDTDVLAGRSVLDAGAATLLSGNPSFAGKPLPLDVALGRIHPEDRGWVFDRIRKVRRTGGLVSLEFRVLSATGEVRWILNRGRLAPDTGGALRGRGAGEASGIRGRPLHPGPFRARSLRRREPPADLEHVAARDRPGAGAARPVRPGPERSQVRQGWAGSSVWPMALAPASATT